MYTRISPRPDGEAQTRKNKPCVRLDYVPGATPCRLDGAAGRPVAVGERAPPARVFRRRPASLATIWRPRGTLPGFCCCGRCLGRLPVGWCEVSGTTSRWERASRNRGATFARSVVLCVLGLRIAWCICQQLRSKPGWMFKCGMGGCCTPDWADGARASCWGLVWPRPLICWSVCIGGRWRRKQSCTHEGCHRLEKNFWEVCLLEDLVQSNDSACGKSWSWGRTIEVGYCRFLPSDLLCCQVFCRLSLFQGRRCESDAFSCACFSLVWASCLALNGLLVDVQLLGLALALLACAQRVLPWLRRALSRARNLPMEVRECDAPVARFLCAIARRRAAVGGALTLPFAGLGSVMGASWSWWAVACPEGSSRTSSYLETLVLVASIGGHWHGTTVSASAMGPSQKRQVDRALSVQPKHLEHMCSIFRCLGLLADCLARIHCCFRDTGLEMDFLSVVSDLLVGGGCRGIRQRHVNNPRMPPADVATIRMCDIVSRTWGSLAECRKGSACRTWCRGQVESEEGRGGRQGYAPNRDFGLGRNGLSQSGYQTASQFSIQIE